MSSAYTHAVVTLRTPEVLQVRPDWMDEFFSGNIATHSRW